MAHRLHHPVPKKTTSKMRKERNSGAYARAKKTMTKRESTTRHH